MSTEELEYLMKTILSEAEKAWRLGEVPVGAMVVDGAGKVLSKSHNLKESTNDPSAHAEILALQQAGKVTGDWRLNGCSLLVSLEPCPMCLGAALQARVQRLVFGAFDPKGGALSLGYSLQNDPRLNHQLEVVGGICHFKASQMLSQFFKERRGHHR